MQLHEAVSRALARHGVDTLFGLLGEANLLFAESFERAGGGVFVSFANESGAVLAAHGYAQVGARIGVATVTHGPGLTNTANALIDSAKEGAPLLVIAGDTATTDLDNIQSIPQEAFVRSTGAGYELMRSPSNWAEHLHRALRRCAVERRPVVLAIPKDFQQVDVEYAPPPAIPEEQAPLPNQRALAAAVSAIDAAERPVVVAGWGAIDARAREGMLRLAGALGAPLATTLRAKGLFSGEERDLGLFGALSHTAARQELAEAGCVIAFGTRLNSRATIGGELLRGKTLVQVDRDPAALTGGDSTKFVLSDAGAAAHLLADGVRPRNSDQSRNRIAARLQEQAARGYDDATADGFVDIRTAMDRLESIFPAERVIAVDGGRFTYNGYTRLHATDPRSLVHSLNYGSVGLGMGNAIGASYAAQGRPVLLLCGDGGFTLGGLNEFVTAVRHRRDIVVVMFNDGAYGAEHILLRNEGVDPRISTFEWPDFGPVATALGGQGFTVRTLDELDAAFAAIAGRTSPMLIDIRVDPFLVSNVVT